MGIGLSQKADNCKGISKTVKGIGNIRKGIGNIVKGTGNMIKGIGKIVKENLKHSLRMNGLKNYIAPSLNVRYTYRIFKSKTEIRTSFVKITLYL